VKFIDRFAVVSDKVRFADVPDIVPPARVRDALAMLFTALWDVRLDTAGRDKAPVSGWSMDNLKRGIPSS
jgi:hypothetical protein